MKRLDLDPEADATRDAKRIVRKFRRDLNRLTAGVLDAGADLRDLIEDDMARMERERGIRRR